MRIPGGRGRRAARIELLKLSRVPLDSGGSETYRPGEEGAPSETYNPGDGCLLLSASGG